MNSHAKRSALRIHNTRRIIPCSKGTLTQRNHHNRLLRFKLFWHRYDPHVQSSVDNLVALAIVRKCFKIGKGETRNRCH